MMIGLGAVISIPNLTQSEIDEVHRILSQPVVQRYFASLAGPIVLDLAVSIEPANGESAESFLRRRSNEHGRLEVLNTLLSFQPAK